MSNIIKIFLLGGDKFMPVMYLRQHEFIHSATESFKKKKKISKKQEAPGLSTGMN